MIEDSGEILKEAVARGDTRLVVDLLQRGADINSFASPPKPPPETPPLNLHRRPAKEAPLETLISIAIRHRNKTMVHLLLEKGVPLNFSLSEESLLRYLCSNYPIPEFTSALEAAAANHDVSMIHLLLAHGAEPYDYRAILKLEDLGHLDSLKLILEA